MKNRDQTTYRGRFSGLRLHAFGTAQILDYKADIEIYQARAQPELWRARPSFSRGPHKWETDSAAALMELIAGDFECCIQPWITWRHDYAQTKRPTLVRRRPDGGRKAG